MFLPLESILEMIRHPLGPPSPSYNELRTLLVASACFRHLLPGHRPRKALPQKLLPSIKATRDILLVSLP